MTGAESFETYVAHKWNVVDVGGRSGVVEVVDTVVDTSGRSGT